MHELIHHSHADGRHYPDADCPIFNAFRRGLPCRIDNEVLWRADGSAVRGRVLELPDHRRRRRCAARSSPSSTSPSASAPHELLQQANDELEQRVAERTRELRERWRSCASCRPSRDGARGRAHAHRARDPRRARPLLVALKMDVNWLDKRVGERRRSASRWHAPSASDMGRLIDTAVDNVGRIITDLRPSILDHQGLWAALEWQAQEFVEISRAARSTAACTSPPACAPPRGGLAIAVFRIFQEMLSNVGAPRAGAQRRDPHRRRRAAAAGAVPRGARRRRRRARREALEPTRAATA